MLDLWWQVVHQGGGGRTFSKTGPGQGNLQKVCIWKLILKENLVHGFQNCPETGLVFRILIRYGHALKIPLKLYKKRLRCIENWFCKHDRWIDWYFVLFIVNLRFDGAHKLMYCENYKIGLVLILKTIQIWIFELLCSLNFSGKSFLSSSTWASHLLKMAKVPIRPRMPLHLVARSDFLICLTFLTSH